ncbi:MAG: iron-containing alcohol dehydrogenase [Pseudomonadota bacterium]
MGKLQIRHPVFRQAPRVTFGRGSLRSALAEVATDSRFVLSSASAVRSLVDDAAERVGVALSATNCFVKPAGEPSADMVRATAAFLADAPGAPVVAVGGGSVLDLARLGWASAFAKLDLETARLAVDTDVEPRFVLVPTTCGTGAEAADVAVYLSDNERKLAAVDQRLLAKDVVLDGRFLDGIDSADMAGFICDALSHAIESGYSVVPSAMAKGIAAQALRTLVANFADAGGDSRKDRLLEGSFWAGLAAANCSVGIVHAFAHSIGAHGVPHGIANAVALLPGIRFNAETSQLNDWLQATSYASVDELLDAIQPIVAAAMPRANKYAAFSLLADAAFRHDLVQAMRSDVAIRANPRRADDTELAKFVDTVADQLH